MRRKSLHVRKILSRSRSSAGSNCQISDHQGQNHGSSNAATHNAIGKQRLVTVTLHIVFHISGHTQQSDEADPEQEMVKSQSTVFHHPYGKNDHRKHQCHRAENLDNADEAVGAHKEGIIAPAAPFDEAAPAE